MLRIDPATGATELIGDDLTDWTPTCRGYIVPPDGIVAAADGKLYRLYYGDYESGGFAAAADGTLYSPPLGGSQVLRIRLSSVSGEGDGAGGGAAAKQRKAEAAAGEAEAEADAAASSKKKRKCKA